MRRVSLATLLIVLSLIGRSWADNPVSPGLMSASDHGDPVLRAMLAELRRSQEKLQLGELQRPYYIDYQVTELQDYQTDAVLGAIRSDQTNARRFVRVVVRIGDSKQASDYSTALRPMHTLPI